MEMTNGETNSPEVIGMEGFGEGSQWRTEDAVKRTLGFLDSMA